MPAVTLSLTKRQAESLWFIIDAWMRTDGRNHSEAERDEINVLWRKLGDLMDGVAGD